MKRRFIALVLLVSLGAVLTSIPAPRAAHADTPTPTATLNYAGNQFPAGVYEAELYEDGGYTVYYNMSCGTSAKWDVVTGDYRGGAALALTANDTVCTIPFYGSALTLWRAYNYPDGYEDVVPQLTIDFNAAIFLDAGQPVADNGDIINSYPVTIGFSTSSVHLVAISNSLDWNFVLDRFMIWDPLGQFAAYPTPIVSAGPDYVVVSGAPAPARTYFATGEDAYSQEQPVMINRTISAGQIAQAVMLFGILALLVVLLGLHLWGGRHA